MPELPDVEVIKRYIDATSLHKEVEHVEVKDDSMLEITPKTLRKHVESQSFGESRRVGKYLFLSADSKWLALHFGMTGNVNYAKQSNGSPEHTRLMFHYDNGGQLAYISQRKLGSVDVTDSPDQFCDGHNLGEDALQIDLKTFRKCMDEKRGMIKSALMDQSTIAGIGNVYSDEILYQCKIYPETNIKKLTNDQVKQLHRNMKRILQTAINNQAKPEEMPHSYLISYRSEGTDCPNCYGKVQRIQVSGRGCYICPNCQEKS